MSNRTGMNRLGPAWVGMARPLLLKDLWDAIATLLPSLRPGPKGGHRPIENRAALTGILFVLRSGLRWEMLPTDKGCGREMSTWRRLRDWQAAGVDGRACNQVMLEHLHAGGGIDWSPLAWTARLSRRKKGLCHRPEPDGPGQAGHEAPLRHRRASYAPYGEPVKPSASA